MRSEALQKALRKEAVYFIGEIGTNHGNDVAQTERLVRACAAAGVDAVKFQSWKVDEFQNRWNQGEDGAWRAHSPAYEVLSRYELSDELHHSMRDLCRELEIDFLSTPFDSERANFLAGLGLPALKISSSDLVYPELLGTVAGLDLPILLSTGMATIEEIREAVSVLGPNRKDLALLHCVAGYPPDLDDANLKAISTLAAEFGCAVGWSDHYLSDEFAVAAVALGATVVEKHVTLSRANDDPDSPFAMEPAEVEVMLGRLRTIFRALGDGVKRCMPSEEGGLVHGRRGVFAGTDLAAGATLTRRDLKLVRPALGDFGAARVADVVGRVLALDVPEGTAILEEHLQASGAG